MKCPNKFKANDLSVILNNDPTYNSIGQHDLKKRLSSLSSSKSFLKKESLYSKDLALKFKADWIQNSIDVPNKRILTTTEHETKGDDVNFTPIYAIVIKFMTDVKYPNAVKRGAIVFIIRLINW